MADSFTLTGYTYGVSIIRSWRAMLEASDSCLLVWRLEWRLEPGVGTKVLRVLARGGVLEGDEAFIGEHVCLAFWAMIRARSRLSLEPRGLVDSGH